MENNKNNQFITSLILEDICQWNNSLTDSRSPTLVHVSHVFGQSTEVEGKIKQSRLRIALILVYNLVA